MPYKKSSPFLRKKTAFLLGTSLHFGRLSYVTALVKWTQEQAILKVIKEKQFETNFTNNMQAKFHSKNCHDM